MTVRKIVFPVSVAKGWSEFSKKEMEKIETYPFPAYTIQQTVKKIQYELELDDNSPEMSKLCSNILLKKRQLIDENTLELGVFLLSHVKDDFHNIAAHRFFSRTVFPHFLKTAGIVALTTDSQKLYLLKTMKSSDASLILEETHRIDELVEEGKKVDVKSFAKESLSIIAHKELPEHLYEELFASNILLVRRSLAYNPNVPSELLKKIYRVNGSQDKNLPVIVASNPSLNPESAEELLNTDLYDRAAKILVEKSSVNKERLFERVLKMKDTPWNTVRGLSADLDISYDLVQGFINTPLLNDCEVVFNLLSNPSIDETTKEFLALSLPPRVALN